MPVAAPNILVPSGGSDYFTDNLDHYISGTVTVDVTSVKYKYAVVQSDTAPAFPGDYSDFHEVGITLTGPVSNEPNTSAWSFRTSKLPVPLSPGDRLHLHFVAFTEGDESPGSEIKVSFVPEDGVEVSVQIPTGISLERFNTHLRVSTQEVDVVQDGTVEVMGYNFYISTSPGGGSDGYKLMNQDLVKEVSSVRKDITFLTSEEDQAGEILVKTDVSSVKDINLFSFDFNRDVFIRMVTAGDLPNIVYNEDSRFFFVISAVAYDSDLSQMIESGYSVEMEGRFLTFSTNALALPPRTRPDILLSITRKVMTANNKLNVISGSVIRDVLDPISDEFSRYYVIQDFVFKASSINSLLVFDDPDGDGISDPVDTSLEKLRLMTALSITDPFVLQTLIDEQFDKLAANNTLTRKTATRAVGTATFYSNDVPEEGLQIEDNAVISTAGDLDLGIQAVTFAVRGGKNVTFADRGFFYNEDNARYEITVDIEAEVSGEIGNVPSGSINIVNSGASPNLRVENQVSTTFGTGRESNLNLANRIKLALVSLDTGTEGGYAKTALSVKGVNQVRVEKVGDPLMMRDMDDNTGRHVGGKVDLYIQGKRMRQVSDQVAFKFGSTLDINGTEVGEIFDVENASSFRIRTKNPRVTASTPIFEVTRIVNVTKNLEYQLPVTIVGDGDTIELLSTTHNLSVGMRTLDIIEVDYKYRSSNTFVLENQPVVDVVSVTGDVDGELPVSNYRLVKLEDPLLTGGSSISKDGVEILFANDLPTSDFNTIENEEHTMVLSVPSDLVNKGVDINSLVVASDELGSVIYVRNVDYSINLGNQVNSTQLFLIPNGKIRNGQTVFVSYRASQNFTIVYRTNELIHLVQDEVDPTKHATADVIAKQAIENKVDVALSVVRKRNTSEDVVKSQIKKVISNHVHSLKMGETLDQSKIISLVEKIPNVKKVVVPFERMMKRNGSFIPMDNLGTLSFKIYNVNAGKGITSYVTVRSVLSYRTTDKGGDPNFFRAIYEDGRSLVLVDAPVAVSEGLGRGYILEDGRLIVSTRDGSPPQVKRYSASYYTFYQSHQEEAGDIGVNQIEYLTVDENSLVINASVEEQFTSRGI